MALSRYGTSGGEPLGPADDCGATAQPYGPEAPADDAFVDVMVADDAFTDDAPEADAHEADASEADASARRGCTARSVKRRANVDLPEAAASARRGHQLRARMREGPRQTIKVAGVWTGVECLCGCAKVSMCS